MRAPLLGRRAQWLRLEHASLNRPVPSGQGEVKTREVLDAGAEGSRRQRPPPLFDCVAGWHHSWSIQVMEGRGPACTEGFTLDEPGLLTRIQVL